MSDRATKSERTFDEAKAVADQYGLSFTNPSEGCFQLRHPKTGWIVNLYPRHSGLSPRAYHDKNHKGPFAPLPQNWTLAEAVVAFAKTWEKAGTL